MTPENFCYWLQGKLEIDGNIESLTKEQVEIINDHLKLVFTKVTPNREKPFFDVEKLEKAMKPKHHTKLCSMPDVYC